MAAECLAAAITGDDQAEWRGGLNRADREQLWRGLERTYRDLRDLELMRTDVNRLVRLPCMRTGDTRATGQPRT